MNLKYKIKQIVYKNPLLKKLFSVTVQQARSKSWQKKLKINGWDMLSKISSALKKQGIDYFLDSGTLLGMIRESGFISHDTDMDLGVLYENGFTEQKLDKALTSIGLKRHHAFYFHDKPAVITYSFDSIAVDFFMYFKTDIPNRWAQYCFERNVWKTYPSDDVFDVYQADCPITGLKTIKVNNLELSVPKNAEEYLASIYTENWRVPNPNWNYLDSPRIHLLEGEVGYRKQ